VQKFERDEAIEAPVAATCEPYLAHAANAELTHERVGPESHVRCQWIDRFVDVVRHEIAVVLRRSGLRIVRTEQRQHVRVELRIRLRELRELGTAFVRRERNEALERRESGAPEFPRRRSRLHNPNLGRSLFELRPKRGESVLT
jgi:hypothetical protein